MEITGQTPEVRQRRRSRLRLRVLLGIAGVLVAVTLFSQLDRSVVKKLGPVAESVHEMFSAPDGERGNPANQKLLDDVKAMGGGAVYIEQSRSLFGLFGRQDLFSINFDARRMVTDDKFGDQALARLVKEHADQIWSIHLFDSHVTDKGLQVLADCGNIRSLAVEYSNPATMRPGFRPQARLIGDAGMVHVGKLTQLQSLHLRGAPVTDAGLGALAGLTGIHVLYLDRTKVEGPGLARLSTLPRLMSLSLSGSAVTNEGLSYLSNVPVVHLMLDDVPLSDVGLKALAGIPSLQRLEIHRSGLDDAAVKKLKKSMPKVQIVD
jgi:hypothetical protein